MYTSELFAHIQACVHFQSLFPYGLLQTTDYSSLSMQQVLVDYLFYGGSEVKASACNAGDPGSIPGSGRSPGEGNGNPLQFSCLENPMDGEAW